jgi:phosphate/sulfate permease
MMEGLIGYLLLCFCVGGYARSRDRSFTIYTLLSIVLSPIIGFALAITFCNTKKRCRECREIVSIKARRCPHCTVDLV